MMIAQETVVEVSEEEEDEEWGTDTQGTERTDSSNKVSWPSSICSGMHGWLPCEEMQKTKDMALLSFVLNLFHGVLIGKREKVLLTPTVGKLPYLRYIYRVCASVRTCVFVCVCVFFQLRVCVFMFMFL